MGGAYRSGARVSVRPYSATNPLVRETCLPRDDPSVKSVLTLWWRAATLGAGDGAYLMRREQYVLTSITLFKALCEHWNVNDAHQAAAEEWARMCGTPRPTPHACISRERFEAGLFALAEAWALGAGHAATVSGCSAFLCNLFRHVTEGTSEHGFKWRAFQDITFAGFQLGSSTPSASAEADDTLVASRTTLEQSLPVRHSPRRPASAPMRPSPRRQASAREATRSRTPTLTQLEHPERPPSPAAEIPAEIRPEPSYIDHDEMAWRKSVQHPMREPELTTLDINIEEALECIGRKEYAKVDSVLQQLRRLEIIGSTLAARYAFRMRVKVEVVIEEYVQGVMNQAFEAIYVEEFDEAEAHLLDVENAFARMPSLESCFCMGSYGASLVSVKKRRDEAWALRAKRMLDLSKAEHARLKIKSIRRHAGSDAEARVAIESHVAVLANVLECDRLAIEAIRPRIKQGDEHKSVMIAQIEELMRRRMAEMQELREEITVLKTKQTAMHRSTMRAASGLGAGVQRATQWVKSGVREEVSAHGETKVDLRRLQLA